VRARFFIFMGLCGRRSRRTAGGRGRSNEDIIIIVENGRVRDRLATTRTGRPRSKRAARQ
jgi:hypothetical protein